jgi:hypothetical protein
LSLVALAATAAAVAPTWLNHQQSHTAATAPIASSSASDAAQTDIAVLPGIRFLLPRGWSATTARPPGEVSLAFFSNQRLIAPTVCPTSTSLQCAPLTSLGPGGVLITVKRAIVSGYGQLGFSKWYTPKEPDPVCSALGGREELESVQTVNDPGGTVSFSTTACIADTSEQALAQARVLLTTAHGDATSTPAPTTPATVDVR